MIDSIIDRTHEEFLKDRSIIIKGEINDKLIEGAVMQIHRWNEEDASAERDFEEITGCKPKKIERRPIKIFIHSPGGIVLDSFSLMSAITTSRTPVHTYAMGIVASAAFMIFICGHRRFIQPYSVLMYHDMTGGSYGKTEERYEALLEVQNFVAMYQSCVLENTKIPVKLLDKIHREKLDYYFYADDCLGKFKIAHGVW